MPSFAVSAPVKAPLMWPKSSDSMSPCESAAQLTATKGFSLRGEFTWIARATSSFPVPLSPRTSTVAWLDDTWRRTSNTRCMALDWPMMPSRP
jgi:hypothetical protein